MRPRIRRMPKGAMMYDPKQVKAFKKHIALIARQQMELKQWDMLADVPIRMNVYFYRIIQKSISKKEHDRRVNGEHLPIVKPDLSNYIKSFEDGLNGIVWKDDALITEIHAYKRYSDVPRIELEIEEIENEKKD